MTDCDKVFLPLDFNSLCNLRDGSLKLTDYYVDYAFSTSGIEQRKDLSVVFYDKYWFAKGDPIPSLTAVLSLDETGSWKASVNGSVFLSTNVPSREYTNAFIGNASFRIENGQTAEIQKLGAQPEKDVLGGMSCFACAPNSELPNFAKIIGMDAKTIEHFFTFSDIKMLPPKVDVNGRIEDSSLIIRGGRNKND